MLLVNKADLLTREQRRAWAKHFQKEGMRAVFWSALAESDRLDAEEKVAFHLANVPFEQEGCFFFSLYDYFFDYTGNGSR